MKPGTKVLLKGRPGNEGVVTDVRGDHAAVFWGNGREEYVRVVDLEPLDASAPFLTPARLLTDLTSRRLADPLTDQLLSYRASRTRMYPHQFIPIRKLVDSPSQRVLIADEVGTGKTIEAGLIWAELDARRSGGLSSVLVVCPKALVEKWREEFLHRFDLTLEHLDSTGLRTALAEARRDGSLNARFSHAVVGLELLRTGAYLEQLEEADLEWDLVIIDEAHHLRNASTKSHAVGLLLERRAAAMAMLTATPVQTSLDDLRNLCRILSIDLAEDASAFDEELSVDMKLNELLSLARHKGPDWLGAAQVLLAGVREARPHLGERIADAEALLGRMDPASAADQVELRSLVRELQSLAPYMTRTLRADVDERRPIRRAETRLVEFTEAQAAFYAAMYESAVERARAKGVPTGFSTQMPSRRTASSAHAVARSIVRDSDASDELQDLARAVLAEQDPKVDALLEAISELGDALVIVFSYFRETLAYLEEVLRERGYRVQQMHGGTPQRDEDCKPGELSRETIAARFRAGEFQVLLGSEVASEGLDFQFCSALINYDLPWNPMRVEQRIGRIDRIGQQSEVVTIVNIATPGTVEHRILERLYERIEVFERALGEMEVVLGEAMNDFTDELFSKNLTPEEQEERLDRIVRLVQQQRQDAEQAEREHGALLGSVQRSEVERDDFQRMERKFLSPKEIEQFVVGALREKHGDAVVRPAGEGEWAVELAPLVADLGTLAQSLFSKTGSQRRSVRRLRNVARKHGKSVRFTFVDPQHQEGVEFVHVRHPLVLLARHYAGHLSSTPSVAYGRVPARDGLPAGRLMLAWAIQGYEGLISHLELRALVVDGAGKAVGLPQEMTAAGLVAEAEPVPGARWTPVLRQLLDDVKEKILREPAGDMAYLEKRNAAAVERARRALSRSKEGRRAYYQKRLREPDLDPKLRRMFESAAARLDRELEEKLQELDGRSAFRPSAKFIGAAVLEVQ